MEETNGNSNVQYTVHITNGLSPRYGWTTQRHVDSIANGVYGHALPCNLFIKNESGGINGGSRLEMHALDEEEANNCAKDFGLEIPCRELFARK